MPSPIYLDYAATTPVDPLVAQAMSKHLSIGGVFGNPASRSHWYGWQAEEAVEVARENTADLINADPREIVFTSGATEANNLALKGIAQQYGDKGKHIITVKTEHKAVLDPCLWLADNGFEVTFLDVGSDGLLDIEVLRSALRPDTILVSIMLVNNETGVIQNINSISALCQENSTYFHVDAAQALGKIPIDVRDSDVDLMSFSAHKLYGPKGIGALYVRRKPKVFLQAQIHGGGHERGMRSGTLATHQIVGLGEACKIAQGKIHDEMEGIRALKVKFWKKVQTLSGVLLNGNFEQSVPGILNLSFEDVEGETLLMALKDLAVSSGSACTSDSLEPSYVLRAMGLSPELAHSAIRFSFGRFTSNEDIEQAANIVCEVVHKLR
ncbi:IscS subfamily cysteine desulfurase [Alteromonas sp. a30]|uniref:IscS subfamily cysteine desulfurase n=1 Tax=Alteromonas sp. a30 TaxID=2730917 RepID=UPI002280C9D9|nr:IscS subfamily cysteine desulfurase [Alteromonas sp. a30]MCY7294593.1 IscS subfamily cysteine desulfurase [Alteromonas sp. a30]